MTSTTITSDSIRAEFDRIKANCYEFSDADICILVAANLLTPIESVQDACIHQHTN